MAGRTTIIISHDPGLYGMADRVVELEDGRLIETDADRRSEAV
jgi:ABC-type siderophore export system fused ATPase/permease subunit